MKHLNEQKYQKTKSTLALIALIIFLVGLLGGGLLIGTGIKKAATIEEKYSAENKLAVLTLLQQEEAELRALKQELEAKLGISEENSSNDIFGIYDSMVDSMMGADSAGDMADIYNSMVGSMMGSMQSGSDAYYPVGSDEYTLQAINAVLSDSGLSSSVLGTSSEYSAYPITAEYCALKTEYNDIAGFFAESNQQSEKMSLLPFYIFGAIVIFACSSTALGIFFVAKRREIVAFAAQGAIPVVQEGMEVMTPSIIKMKEEFARSKARMAAENADHYSEAFGKVAREVSKGINEGRGKSGSRKDFWEED